MANVIFPMNRLKHRTWSNRLRRLLDDQIQELDDSYKNTHKDCDLGKWYYTDGLKEYGNISEFKEIESFHEKFHQLVQDVVKLKEAGDTEKAEATFTELGYISEKVILLLDVLEKKADEIDIQKAAG